jgi:ribonuclease HII
MWFDDLISSWQQDRKDGRTNKALHQHLQMTEKQLEHHLQYMSEDYLVAGSDEVGYGALAGPLIVCAVLAPAGWQHPGLADSKKLSPKRRQELSSELHMLKEARIIDFHFAQAQPARIDELGVGTALRRAHCSAMEVVTRGLGDQVLPIADGNLDLPGNSIVSLPKADTFVPQVMAASILAKVHRDGIMVDLSKEYVGYGFEAHMGYGTAAHYEALERLGPCACHRLSYRLKGESDATRDAENDRPVRQAS